MTSAPFIASEFMEVVHRGQLYERVRTEPFERKDGGASEIAIWRSTCAQCEDPFECTHRSKAFREVECVCQCCGETFMGKRADAEYCSKTCHRFAYRVKTGRLTRISPPVLDYLFRQQGLRITGEKIAA